MVFGPSVSNTPAIMRFIPDFIFSGSVNSLSSSGNFYVTNSAHSSPTNFFWGGGLTSTDARISMSIFSSVIDYTYLTASFFVPANFNQYEAIASFHVNSVNDLPFIGLTSLTSSDLNRVGFSTDGAGNYLLVMNSSAGVVTLGTGVPYSNSLSSYDDYKIIQRSANTCSFYINNAFVGTLQLNLNVSCSAVMRIQANNGSNLTASMTSLAVY